MIYLVGGYRAFDEYVSTNTIVDDTVEAGEIVAIHISSPEQALGFRMTSNDKIVPLHDANDKLVGLILDKRMADMCLPLFEKMDEINALYDSLESDIRQICP